MPNSAYSDPVPAINPSAEQLRDLLGKSVVITGGAKGIGRFYVKAFVEAGANVTFGDYDESAGRELEAALSGKAMFVKADVRVWEDQVALFETAIQSSPHHSCDVVIANAGIVGGDDLYSLEDPSLPPLKPKLRIIETNLIGMSYTAKLAMHYFRRQPDDASRDRCLILQGSIASYIDQPYWTQYNITKWGIRSMMRNLRHTCWKEGIRVNMVAPWYVQTSIMPDNIWEHLRSNGFKFTASEDCAKAMLYIAATRELHGRAIGVMEEGLSPSPIIDLDVDEYKDGGVLATAQADAVEGARLMLRFSP